MLLMLIHQIIWGATFYHILPKKKKKKLLSHQVFLGLPSLSPFRTARRLPLLLSARLPRWNTPRLRTARGYICDRLEQRWWDDHTGCYGDVMVVERLSEGMVKGCWSTNLSEPHSSDPLIQITCVSMPRHDPWGPEKLKSPVARAPLH